MGIFDFGKKRDEHISRLSHFRGAIMQSFSHLKQDLNVQKQWISYLNHIHHVLKSAHDKHRALTKRDLDDLKKYIDHLNDSAGNYQKAMKQFEHDLRATIETYNKNFTDVYNRLNDAKEQETKLKQQIMDDVQELIQESQEKTQKNIEELHEKVKPVQKEIPITSPATLTNPEQKLLNLLVAETDPVSYGHIAERTGNSINTVRVIMNNLKKRGLIEEHTLPSGVKLFNASNKEKVKKLYNIEHM